MITEKRKKIQRFLIYIMITYLKLRKMRDVKSFAFLCITMRDIKRAGAALAVLKKDGVLKFAAANFKV
jgi:hypothetical protein